MNKKTAAAILLAGLTLTAPVFASDDTVDEYSHFDKYANPGTQTAPAIVNDWKGPADGGEEGILTEKSEVQSRSRDAGAQRRAAARRSGKTGEDGSGGDHHELCDEFRHGCEEAGAVLGKGR